MRMRNPKDKDIILKNCDFYYEGEFKNDFPIYLEIGMGKGDFIIGMAKAYPNINFIGVEKFSSVASIAIKKITNENLNNVKVLIMDIKDSIPVLTEKIDRIYLNFSDPWPKERHAKRRLTHTEQLRIYDLLFKGINEIIMKTDNDDLFEYSLTSFKDYGYKIKEIYYDLHSEDIFNVLTEYEDKFSKKGVKIKYVHVIKK